jgi:hypothetical protein
MRRNFFARGGSLPTKQLLSFVAMSSEASVLAGKMHQDPLLNMMGVVIHTWVVPRQDLKSMNS